MPNPAEEQSGALIRIEVSDPASAEAHALLESLDGYLTRLYPPESNYLLSVESLQRPNVTFLTASKEGRVVGCGAIVNHGGEFAELKRMFVLAEVRGLGIGRRILDDLEARARSAGLRVVRLETGISQPEAILLYEKAGYRRRGRFGSYPEDPLSVFMEKTLE